MAQRRNVIDILEKEHRTVEKLLDQLCSTESAAKRGQLIGKLHDEVFEHSMAEERVLYRRLEKEESLRHEALESTEEHRIVRQLIKELDRNKKDNDRWHAKLTVLNELLRHHIEEEEGEMFPSARKQLGEEELKELGRAYQEEKRQLKV